MTSSCRTFGAKSLALGKRPVAAALAIFVLSLGPWSSAVRAQSTDADKLEGLRPILTKPEAALVQASRDLRSGAVASVIEGLRKLSSDHAGEEVSGLAQVMVANASLALGRFDDAASAARHPDIDRTGLGDRALLTLARAKARAGDYSGSASAYLRAVDAAQANDVACSARLGAAAALEQIKQGARRVALLSEAVLSCQGQADVRLDLAEALLGQGSRDEALVQLEAIEGAYPTAPQAQTAATLIGALLDPSGAHPNRSARQDFERRLARAKALLDGGQRAAGLSELRKLKVHRAIDQDVDTVQVAIGRALSRTSPREAKAALALVPDTSASNPEARLLLARLAPEAERPARLNEIVGLVPGTPVAEQALYSLATFFQKDALYAEAAPYYLRLVNEFAEGPYAEGAAMRAAFEALRAGRFEAAALPLETMARRAGNPAGFLYWAGIARQRNGEALRATALLNETADRFRNTWYGRLAGSELSRWPAESATTNARVSGLNPGFKSEELPGPFQARLRQLLLVGFDAEALEELRPLGNTSAALEARALIESDRGELRNAIVHMKRAHPEFISAEIKDLPTNVWTTIYPLKHGVALKNAAWREDLDPALVAALVCQESTFDERARSSAGARGLMQIMPYTGRPLARELGLRFNPKMLHEAETSLTFGTRYLRQMMVRFGLRPEAALAAYNAGPHRVDKWLAQNPQIRSDEFAESIPFTETRNYVMIILGARDQYRKLYGLEPAAKPGP